METVKKLRSLIFEPGAFFSRLKEEGIENAFVFMLILAVFYSLLWSAVSLIIFFAFSSLGTGIVMNMFFPALTFPAAWMIIAYGGFYFISLVAGSFISAAILYVWLLIWGVRPDFNSTYQLSVYGNSPTYLLGWFPVINWFVWIWSMILLIIGTMKMYKVSKVKAILIYLIPVIIAFSVLTLIFLFFIVVLGSFAGTAVMQNSM